MDVDSDYSPAASPLPKATAAPLGNATNKVCGLESGSNAAEGRGSWLGGAAWQMRAAFALALAAASGGTHAQDAALSAQCCLTCTQSISRRCHARIGDVDWRGGVRTGVQPQSQLLTLLT